MFIKFACCEHTQRLPIIYHLNKRLEDIICVSSYYLINALPYLKIQILLVKFRTKFRKLNFLKAF